jgi:NADPH-dependent 7-cyano-7-deazaguanine reductase QueF
MLVRLKLYLITYRKHHRILKEDIMRLILIMNIRTLELTINHLSRQGGIRICQRRITGKLTKRTRVMVT